MALGEGVEEGGDDFAAEVAQLAGVLSRRARDRRRDQRGRPDDERDRDPTGRGYRRVLLKMSGEALLGDGEFGHDRRVLRQLADDCAAVHAMGVELCMVIGGGNIIRGSTLAAAGVERATADYMGMLGTVINALARAERDRAARRHPDPGDVGDPDVGGVRALHPPPRRPAPGEGPDRDLRRRHRQPVLHHRHRRGTARGRDGLRRHPEGHPGRRRLLRRSQARPDAQRFDRLTYLEVLARDLKVMDASAISLARESSIPIIVFSVHAPGAFARVAAGRRTPHHHHRGGRGMSGRAARPGGSQEAHGRALEVLRKELQGLRTGRASASLLEPIIVEAYGSEMPLNQVGHRQRARAAHAHRAGAGTAAWSRRSRRRSATAALGLNPAVDGQLIRVPLPELTQERRNELVKVAHRYAEQARVAVRNVRRDGMDQLEAAREGRRRLAGRARSTGPTRCRSSPTGTSRRSTSCSRTRKRTSCRSDGRGSVRSEPLSGGASRPAPPTHVAIIMDGNGRWARSRGMPPDRTATGAAPRRAPRGRGRAREGHPLPDAVCVLLGELEPAGRRGRRADGPAAALPPPRDRRAVPQRRRSCG